MAIEDKYRIKRTDTRNVVIQRKSGKAWRTVSYHGNSPFSLIRGLLELIMKEYSPEDEKLSEQLKKVELALISGVDRVERMLRDYDQKKSP